MAYFVTGGILGGIVGFWCGWAQREGELREEVERRRALGGGC